MASVDTEAILTEIGEYMATNDPVPEKTIGKKRKRDERAAEPATM